MDLEYRKLNEEEIATACETTHRWEVEEGKLAREFEFEEYLGGVAFAARVGRAAEELNHHPDIHIGYRRVKVSVNTHDVQGLSPYDFELARRINALQQE
jgi:4a-hydroxytetrahydrobiopterin dehydratase